MENLKEMTRALGSKLNDFQGKKVFIFGDVGIDEYVQGAVTRISPEAPVPVVEVQDTDKKLGLSGNVAANVQALGGIPLLFSLVGEDANAERLGALLADKGISSENLLTDPNRNTTTKLRVMTGHHHIVRVDYETRSTISNSLFETYKNMIQNGIESSDVVIIQDYAKGQINQETAQAIIGMAKQHGKKVLVDPYRSTPLSWYRGSDFMTPNRDEALELAKQIPKPEIWADVDSIGKELMNSIESEKMVITLGPEGVQIFENGQIDRMPTFARKVFDVTGAGDTVIAAFSLAMAAGWSLKDAAFFANMAAGVVVGHVGAVACKITDLKQYLSLHE